MFRRGIANNILEKIEMRMLRIKGVTLRDSVKRMEGIRSE